MKMKAVSTRLKVEDINDPYNTDHGPPLASKSKQADGRGSTRPGVYSQMRMVDQT